MSAVLRPCEATTYEGLTLIPKPCGKPGGHWESPSGTAYMLCESHVAVFARHFGAGGEESVNG